MNINVYLGFISSSEFYFSEVKVGSIIRTAVKIVQPHLVPQENIDKCVFVEPSSTHSNLELTHITQNSYKFTAKVINEHKYMNHNLYVLDTGKFKFFAELSNREILEKGSYLSSIGELWLDWNWDYLFYDKCKLGEEIEDIYFNFRLEKIQEIYLENLIEPNSTKPITIIEKRSFQSMEEAYKNNDFTDTCLFTLNPDVSQEKTEDLIVVSGRYSLVYFEEMWQKYKSN